MDSCTSYGPYDALFRLAYFMFFLGDELIITKQVDVLVLFSIFAVLKLFDPSVV